MIDVRQDFHMHPELSFKEVRTPKIIAEHLKRLASRLMKMSVQAVSSAFFAAEIQVRQWHRADFDALPMQDEKDAIQIHSRRRTHACGHDIHTTALMMVEKVLVQYKDQLDGTIIFIHQHGEEEPPGGASEIIASVS